MTDSLADLAREIVGAANTVTDPEVLISLAVDGVIMVPGRLGWGLS